jgi:hypothetical protein
MRKGSNLGENDLEAEVISNQLVRREYYRGVTVECNHNPGRKLFPRLA